MTAILLVEDHDGIRSALASMLALDGHAVLQARDAAEAVRLVERDDGRIALAVVKAPLPEPGTAAVIESLRRRSTPLRVILISEYAPQVLRRMPIMEALSRTTFNGFRYLAKPFSHDALAHTVAELLARPLEAVQVVSPADWELAD